MEGHCAGPVQVAGQVRFVPSHANGLQEGLPVRPCGAVEQVPSLPGTSQASHAFEHAVSQQYPSTQLLLLHCALPTQAEP